MAVYEITVAQFLPFIDGDTPNPQGEAVTDTFVMREAITINKKTEALTQRFNVGQAVRIRQSKSNLRVNQFLAMWDKGSHGKAITVTQFLHMWDKGRPVKTGSVTHNLNVHQSIVAKKGKEIISTLVMTQTITAVIKRARTVSQTFHITQNQNAYYVSDCETTISRNPYYLLGPNGSPSYVW